jgi:hypothetical protein
MAHHRVTSSARAVETAQIYQINEHLSGQTVNPVSPPPKASDLELAGVQIVVGVLRHTAVPASIRVVDRKSLPRSLTSLSGDARLTFVTASGETPFRYVFGLFSDHRTGGPLVPVALDTYHLREISRHLHLRHRWTP